MPTAKEHWGYTLSEWDKPDFQSLIPNLPDTPVFFDVGANVGGVTEVLRKRYPNLKAYCFEPVSVNYQELINNVPYATNFQKGIYYGKSESQVLWRGGNDGAYFVEHIDAGEPRVPTGEIMELVELESLDLPTPDLIKLDVEGAEENIIEHSRIVKECKHLIIEWHPSKDPIAFFKEHLPNHEIVVNLGNHQFLLVK